jgi:hypothetical protein
VNVRMNGLLSISGGFDKSVSKFLIGELRARG